VTVSYEQEDMYIFFAAECGPRLDQSLLGNRRCVKPCVTDSVCRGVLKKCRCDEGCGLSCFNPGLCSEKWWHDL